MLALAATALLAPLLVRHSQVNISPPEQLPLGGYTERKGKVMDYGGDALYARCVELEQGSTKIAVVSVDMLTIPESLYREVTARIPKDIHLFLQATHTHCAPDSQMLNDRMTFQVPGIASYRKQWLSWYAQQLATTVELATEDEPERPSQVEVTEFQVKANRARRRGGKPDRTATRVYGAVPGGLDLIFGHFAAHPIIYGPDENHTRGDWPAALSHQWGGIVLNGAIGDVSPNTSGKSSDARMKSFLDRFAYSEQYSHSLGVVWRSWDKFKWVTQPIALDAKKPHPTFAKAYGVPQPIAQMLMDQFAPSSAQISAFRIGDLAVIGVPGEPSSFLGNKIKAVGLELGFHSVLVCSHVNGWMGYVLDPKDYDRGGYEGTLSFYGRNEALKVIDAAIKALKKLQ